MEIAIIGAGYAGLATAIALKRLSPGLSIVVYSKEGPSASSVSTGLLHPLMGKFAKKTLWADEGLLATLDLIRLAEKALNQSVCSKCGIARIANHPFQLNNYQRVMKKYPESKWIEKPGAFHPFIQHPLLYLPEGITVFSGRYLQGLKLASLTMGIRFETKTIIHPKELKEDQIIFCSGADTLDLFEQYKLPLERVKGQALTLRYPKGFKPFSCSLMSKGHLSVTENSAFCQIGSSYERGFSSVDPDEKAIEVLEQIAEFLPEIKEFEIVEAKAGIRVCRVGSYLPLVQPLDSRNWIFTGLGSRGLIYHGFLANLLAEALLFKKPIPKELVLKQKRLQD